MVRAIEKILICRISSFSQRALKYNKFLLVFFYIPLLMER